MMALTPAAAPVRATVSMSAASDFVVGGKATPKDWTSDEIQDRDGLKDLALQLNPIVGYYGAKAARIGKKIAPRALVAHPAPPPRPQTPSASAMPTRS